MPTYEFRCPEGHEFETFYRTISGAASTAECPTCGVLAVRMMSATGFAFKGSGFYLTDYGKNAHRGEAAPTPGSGDSAATDSTPKETGFGGKAVDAPAEGASSSTKGAEAPPKPAAKEKKAEPKAVDSKPAAPAPKSGTSE